MSRGDGRMGKGGWLQGGYWREDARLTSTAGHAENELRQHERDLASMMDKVFIIFEFRTF